MGFGYGTRTAEDLQRDNRQIYSFAKIKERYEQTIPLRGKRAKLNIRPHGQRDRAWERIVKVNENEYYLTNDAYSYYENHPEIGKTHQRLMSFKQVDDTEYFTLHTPRVNWYPKDHPSHGKLNAKQMGIPSYFWFIHYNMPQGLDFYNINSRKYVKFGDDYYSAEKGDITFTRQGKNEWKPLVVHREVIHILDREKTKEVREKAKEFLNYSKVMCQLVDAKWKWGNPLVTDDTYTWEDKLKMNDDGSYPEDWLPMLENFKHRATSYWNGFNEKSLRRIIINDLYSVAKPCKEIEVPLGKPCYDRYGKWY